MKKLLMNGVITFAIALLAPRIVQAQGTMTYLSNLGQTSVGSLAVGSNSWLAVGFETGTNAGGYTLNSIELGMTDASGNPSNFVAMLYSAVFGTGVKPGNSLGTLNGSLNPVTGGIFTYTPAANLTLSSVTDYFIVLTAGTAVANGAYEWSYAGSDSYNSNGGWVAPLGISAIYNYQSSDGSHWNFFGGPSQFAINAIPIPEPGVLGVLGLGALLFLWHRRKAKAV